MFLLYQGETQNPNFRYHAGVDIDHAFLIFDGRKKALLVHRMNAEIAKATFRGKVVVYQDALKELPRLIRRKTVCYDALSISASLGRKLGRICRLKDCSEELEKMRLVKKPDEISKISRAARETKDIIDSLDFKRGMSEQDIKKRLIVEAFERGLELAYDPIVAADRNTRFPHYRGGKKKAQSLLLVDFGVKFEGYCSDITRCFILDGDRKKKERYERLKDICWFIADSLPQMKAGKEATALSDELISKAGFPKMIHSIGHGIGLEVHERPGLGPHSEDALAGAAVAIEPAFYLSNYGMRYEETVYNGGKKARIL